VDVDISQSPPGKRETGDKPQRFVVRSYDGPRQRIQHPQYFVAISQIAYSKFTDHKRVCGNLVII